MKAISALTAALALALLSPSAHAQPTVTHPQPTTAPHADAPPHRERARTFLVLRIVDALNLNEQDAIKVSNIVRQSDDHRQQLVKQRQGLEGRLHAALAKKPSDPAELGKLVTDGNDIDQKIALIPEDTFHEMQKVLTVEQQAKLILFRRELQGEIRRAMQGRHGGGAKRARQGTGATEEP